MAFMILSLCSARLPSSTIIPLPGDDQSVGGQKNPGFQSLAILSFLCNRLSQEEGRVEPKGGSGENKHNVSRLTWASRVDLPPLGFVVLSLVHLEGKYQMRCKSLE